MLIPILEKYRFLVGILEEPFEQGSANGKVKCYYFKDHKNKNYRKHISTYIQICKNEYLSFHTKADVYFFDNVYDAISLFKEKHEKSRKQFKKLSSKNAPFYLMNKYVKNEIRRIFNEIFFHIIKDFAGVKLNVNNIYSNLWKVKDKNLVKMQKEVEKIQDKNIKKTYNYGLFYNILYNRFYKPIIDILYI